MKGITKRKSKPDSTAPPMSDKVAEKIALACMSVQKSFAGNMNKAFERVNNRRLKMVLILFCLIAGGYSLYLIVCALTMPPKANDALKIEQATVPKHFDKTGAEIAEPESYVDEHTYGQIQFFKAYMDSLKAANSPLYDSIVLERPYLMDSIQALEQLYSSQNHK